MTARKNMKKLSRSSRGQAVIEFAMVLPLLLVVGFIITEFGRALWVKNVLSQAAREGARKAVVNEVGGGNSTADLDAVIYAENFLTEGGMRNPGDIYPAEVTATFLDTDGFNGDDALRVVVTKTFTFVPDNAIPTMPFAQGGSGTVNPFSFEINAVVIMHLEGKA